MAKKIVEHTRSTENIHQSALGLIAELDEHVEKIYAVASGGRSGVPQWAAAPRRRV